ncbi:MAG: aminotransferase class I/II-fold pyridoxal phosphate-dependent enzyme [Candidatus Hydrogenedentes bacterium]|nr:aminotransferase class I/II-fold pyridoxal phosphate-dependent enzyme [Candidatus Hydrogenedentota bacterium]
MPTLEEKRALARELLAKKAAQSAQKKAGTDYKAYSYDMFMQSLGREPVEIDRFGQWIQSAKDDGIYAFESARTTAQRSEVDLVRETGEQLHMLNLSSYNYLGLSFHPEVIKAAQDAVARFGLGAASSPVISGTYTIHKELEDRIVRFFGLPGRRASLFSSGYGVNLGAIQAFVKPGGHVVLDQSAHMSLLEGAKLSGAEMSYFRHNDMEHLEEILKTVSDPYRRVLVCAEGVYSGEGDFGKLKEIVALAKLYGAYTLVDEAHSALVAGENGRGVCEEQGVLEDVDLYVMTFSKAFGGVGGALLAKSDVCQYVNWYAKCRMFSCALDPAVTAGMTKVIEIAGGPEGRERRKRLIDNANYLRERLRGKVDLGKSASWIVTVIYGSDKIGLNLNDFLQRNGLDTSLMQFPAVPKNEARIRMFVTSEHTREQLDRVVEIIEKAKQEFNFI